MMFKYVKKQIINFVADKFGVPEKAINYFKPMSIVGKQTKAGLPKNLVSMNILNMIRGLFNQIVFASHSSWVWPFWVVQQYDSKSLGFIPRGFQLPAMNVANRNWTAIGKLGNTKEAIVDVRGLVTPRIYSWSVDVWVHYKNKLYAPSRMKLVKQRVIKTIPMIETSFEAGNFLISTTVFVQTIQERDTIFHSTKITNFGEQGEDISLIISIRPYNPEGISLVNKCSYKNNIFFVNGHLGVVLKDNPTRILMSNYENGDINATISKKETSSIFDVKCNAGLVTAGAEYDLFLNPNEEKEIECRIAMDKNAVISKEAYLFGKYEDYKQKTFKEWSEKVSQGIKIIIPDKRLEKAFEANISYLLLFHDGKSITPGPFNYHHFWFRDAAYLIQGLIKCGFSQEAKEVLSTYPSRQRFDGYFYSQLTEWDSNGQAIWIIAEYYKFTKDIAFLRKLIPSVYIGAKWIVKKLKKEYKKKHPYKGLMPIGLSAEHFGANGVYYWDDYWSLKGLIDAKYLIDEVPEERFDASFIDKAIHNLKNDIDVSLEIAAAKEGKPCMPIGPERYIDSGAIGSLVALYPLYIFEPNDERLVNTVEMLRERCFTNNAFFHDINHSGHGTYLNAHIAQFYLSRRDNKALELIYWLLDKTSNTFTWPESIHPFTFGGVVGDGHHGWAAADFLIVVRNMMLLEEKEKLVFTPVVPKEWFYQNAHIAIQNAPTHFGIVNFRYHLLEDNFLEIIIDCIFSIPPKSIEINLPFHINKIIINEAEQQVLSNNFTVSPDTRLIKVFYND
jgi:hypothetical protein